MNKVICIKNDEDKLFSSEIYYDKKPLFTSEFKWARTYNTREGAERSIIRNNLINCEVVEVPQARTFRLRT